MNAIYARQSVDKKDSLSIEGQISMCKKFAGAEALIYSDRGYSGKNTKRPAFTELIKAFEAGKVKKIYVYRLDRFSRSIADFSKLWEMLERHGVEFFSVTEHFDTSSPIGRAMLNIVLVFAQLERETTAERVRDNYLHRFGLGAWPGGTAPYGYDISRLAEDGKSTALLVENKFAETVKYIFAEYGKNRVSLRDITKKLAEQGIKGPKRSTWDNVTLSRILHSPVYVKANEEIYWYFISKGIKISCKTEAFDGIHGCNIIGRRNRSSMRNLPENQSLTVARHIGIIEPWLWITVQEKLEKNRQLSKEGAGKYSWLTGLIKCAQCGYAIKINHSKKENKIYLICSGRSNLAICDNKISVNLHELEAYISAEISQILLSAAPKPLLCSNSSSKEILDIEKKIDRLVKALTESSSISAGYISNQIEKLHKQHEMLTKCPDKQKEYIIDFEKLNLDEKKTVACEFIEKILLKDNSVNILWRF